jgi:hypothetical protein
LMEYRDLDYESIDDYEGIKWFNCEINGWYLWVVE